MENNLPKVAIIDYEMGNMFSVEHACRNVGLDPVITSDPKTILSADAAILPGVGAFSECMNNLRKFDLVSVIKEFIDSKKPFIGICLGLQLLFTESEEFGLTKGLDIISGVVRKFPALNPDGFKLRVPQIGWNHIYKKDRRWKNSILNDTTEKEFMYFVHSYYVIPENQKDILTLTNYCGLEFCSAVHRGNINAFQFHPEKSAENGLKVYRNFKRLIDNG
ncbi:imidazole glycerol phosphate synthase subunit HisH [soil metagenome]